jgi:hypothetical protein
VRFSATLLLILLCLAATAAWPTPSTLIWIPSTDVQVEGTWHLGIDDYFPAGTGTSAPTDVGLTWGGRRWELGVDYFGGTDDPLAFNGKLLVLDEPRSGADGVIGLYAVGTDPNATAYDLAYALLSKHLGAVRATAGYFKGRRSLLGRDDSGIMLGLDGSIADRWWAAVDYQGGESSFGATSFGVSYSFTPDVGVILGFVDFHDSALDDSITTQVDINF